MNANRVLAGLGWSTLSTAVSAVCQVAFMAVLGRLLDPTAFGLMAMAAIALRFGTYFAQLGFAQSLIQRAELQAADTAAAVIMACGLGLALYLVLALAAPLFAAGFHAPALTSLIDALGVSLLLSTLGGLPLALLRRQARFKRVNAIELASFVLGYGSVGIACAAQGLGVWSLVAATLSQQLLLVILGFAAVRYPLVWPVPRQAFVRLWSFGSRYSMIGFLEFIHGNVETLFVGRVLGAADLGRLNRASTLTSLPIELGVTAVNKVLFPALAAMQHDSRRLADGFQMLLLCTGLFSAALACGIAASASDLLVLVLGAKWASISPLVVLIALSVPSAFMYVACGVTMDSMAILGPKLWLQTAMLILKVALVFGLARWGIAGVAAAVAIAELLRLLAGLAIMGRLLAIEWGSLLAIVGLVLLMGAVVAGAVAAARALGLAASMPLLARVILEMMAGGSALTATLLGLVLGWPAYAPMQRFETLRQWQLRVLGAFHHTVASP